MNLRARLKHAFAVDPPGAAEPTVEQQPAVDWVCMQVAKRRLTTPGLIFLEMSRPLNWIGAQAMHFCQPGVWALAAQRTYDGYVHFSQFLERRGSMEYLVKRIEHFEEQFTRIEKQGGRPGRYIQEHFEKLRHEAETSKSQKVKRSEDETDEWTE